MPRILKDELGTREPALPGNALNWIGGERVSVSSATEIGRSEETGAALVAAALDT